MLARDGFALGPFESVAGIIVAASFSFAIAADSDDAFRIWLRLGAASAIATPAWLALSLAASTARVRSSIRHVASAAVAALALAYTFGVFDEDARPETIRLALLVAAAWSALPTAAHVLARGTSDPGHRAWSTNIRLAERFGVAFLLALGLLIGLSAALAAVNALFGLHLDEDPYLHLLGSIMFGLVPVLIVGGLEEISEPLRGENPDPARGARWVMQYLLFPLVATYLAILYAYMAKALGSSELPRNALTPLTLGAGALGIAGSLLSRPFLRSPTPPLSARFFRVATPLLLPTLPLALWALAVRVEQYGWTEFRLIRMYALFALLVIGLSGLRGRLTKHDDPGWLSAATFSTLALVAALPWVGATAIGVRSQQARMFDGLEAAGLLDADGTLSEEARCDDGADARDGTDRVGDGPCARVHGAAHYLVRRLGDEEVARLLGVDAPAWGVTTMLEERGVTPWYPSSPRVYERWVHAALTDGAPVPDVPAGTFHRIAFHASEGDETVWRGGLGQSASGLVLSVHVGTPESSACSFDLTPLLELSFGAAPASNVHSTARIPPEHALVPADRGICGTLLVERLAGTLDSSGQIERIQNVEGIWIRPPGA